MRITCPNCQAVYEVADLLAFGIRKLRCVCCGTSWETAMRPIARPAALVPLPEEITPPLEPPPEPMVEPGVAATVREAMLPSGKTKSGRLTALRRSGTASLAAAWAASVVVILGGGCAAWRFQASLCHAWPPLGRLATLVASIT